MKRDPGIVSVSKDWLAELEAEQDVVTIDGKRWRLVDPVISTPRHPADGTSHLLRSHVEPVE